MLGQVSTSLSAADQQNGTARYVQHKGSQANMPQLNVQIWLEWLVQRPST